MKLRFAGTAALAAVVALAASGGGFPASRIVGGTGLLVQEAPWAVYVKLVNGSTGSFCSGTVVDAQHVLTAGHCVYLPDGSLAAASALTVRAGISNYAVPLGGDAEQDRNVDSVRVHPGYRGPRSGSADDVALLTLASALDLDGPSVQAVELPSPGSGFPSPAVEVGFAGFGRETAGRPANGSLNWLAGRVDDQGTCGGLETQAIRDADAVSFCAAATNSAVCGGDSGAGLVTSGPQRILVGVVSAGQAGCATGTRTIFTAVWPAEVLRFIEGDDSPPTAPRRTVSTYVRLFWDRPLVPGRTLICISAGWGGDPSITYAFVSARGRVLQEGPEGVLRLGARSAGEILSCRASATNAGGTAVLTTDWVGTVAPTPTTAVSSRKTAHG